MGDADNLERPLPLGKLSVPERIEIKNGWLAYSVLPSSHTDRIPPLTDFLKLTDAPDEKIPTFAGLPLWSTGSFASTGEISIASAVV